METSHTLYEWCFLNTIRPLDIDLSIESEDADIFMQRKISLAEFKDYMEYGHYKEKSLPRKPEKYLELRMYGLVPYNISEIQKGIQFNHANDNYSLLYSDDEEYLRFRKEWMTNIILNGGTSNEGTEISQGFKKIKYVGTMQKYLKELNDVGIKLATFYEPDLNSMLSAIVFLVDERVFNKELYPDFVPPSADKYTDTMEWMMNQTIQYEQWVEKIGGGKNAFLREFLLDKKLA